MRKVLPYIETLGSRRFKNFLLQEFSVDVLDNVTYSNSNILFDGWKGGESEDFYTIVNEKTALNFHKKNEYYEIITPWKEEFSLPLPYTINDFINDMCRLGIELHWSKWMDENFEPKEYMSEKDVEEYFRDLLKKMDKSHELSDNL